MDPKSTKAISRRDAMKILGAAAGASVLASLPSKWSKPELTAGVLPAHAQTSGPALSIVKTVLKESFSINFDAPPQSIELQYTLTVQNTGAGPAMNVHVLDTMDVSLDPFSLVVVSTQPPGISCTVAGQVLDCNLGTLAAGQTDTMTFTIRLSTSAVIPAGGSLTVPNTGTVNADGLPALTSNLVPVVISRNREGGA